MTNRSLPTVTSQIPQDLRNFLNRVREIVGSELASGADLERSRQTLNGELNRLLAQQHADLVNLESVVNTVAESLAPNRPCGATVAPSQPTGAQAWGAFEAIALTWDTPDYCGHQSTEVWVAEADDFELAELAGEVAYATTFTHALAANQTRWYWLRFVNDDGVKGPFTAESVTATTAIDLEAVLLALTGQITESQLYQDIAARINLIDGPVDLLGSVAAQFAQEGLDRSAEIAAEAAARAAAVSAAFDQAQSEIDAADARITTVKGELETDLAGAQAGLNARIDDVNATLADIEATADFDTAESYALGTAVRYNSKLYRAIQATTAPSPLPTDTAYWEKIGDYATFAEGMQAHSEAISALNTVSASSESANAQALAAVTATVNDPTTGLTSRAAVTDLDEAVADIYGAEVSRFSGLEATFSYDAAQREITNLGLDVFSKAEGAARIDSYERTKADIFGASAESFSGLAVEFQGIVDANAGISQLNNVSVDSDSALASTVAGMRAEMYDPVSGTLSLATKTDITDLESDIYGASASSFTGLSAQFQDIANAKSDITQLNTITTSSGSALARKVANIESAVDDLETGTAGGASIAYVDATAADIYGASASSFTGLTATFSDLNDDIDAKATITEVNEVLANGDSTTALAVKQLAAGVVDGNQTLIDVTAKADALGGQYTVKIDSNDHVTGWGLALGPDGESGAVESSFIVRANKFAIAYPGETDIVPFQVRTSNGYVNGEYVPAGVYIDGGHIMGGTIEGSTIIGGTITNSHLIDVSASKITSGAIDVGNIIQSTSYSAGNYGWKIDGAGNAEFNGGTFRGITVKDAAGNIILSSGKVLASKVDGLGTLATANSVAYSALTGTKPPTDADKTSANTAAGITGQGALATLSSVTSTYIANAAITEAKITNAAVSTLKIDGNAVTVTRGYVNNTDYGGYGVGSWRVLNTQSISNAGNNAAIRVLLQFTARVGYFAGVASVRFQITHFPSYSVIADSGQTEGYADYAVLSAAVDISAYGSGSFAARFYSSNSSTKVESSCFLLTGLKR